MGFKELLQGLSVPNGTSALILGYKRLLPSILFISVLFQYLKLCLGNGFFSIILIEFKANIRPCNYGRKEKVV